MWTEDEFWMLDIETPSSSSFAIIDFGLVVCEVENSSPEYDEPFILGEKGYITRLNIQNILLDVVSLVRHR